MKKRYIYSVLFGIPGFIFSIILSLVVFGFSAGFLWLFVFGDNKWPSSSENLIFIVFALVFLIVWCAITAFGFVIGKRLEHDPVLNKKHILVSTGVTFLLLLMIVLYQFRVGNLGPKSDSVRCSDHCSQLGYPASSLPARDSGDRTCSCLDNAGMEVIQIPLEGIVPGE